MERGRETAESCGYLLYGERGDGGPGVLCVAMKVRAMRSTLRVWCTLPRSSRDAARSLCEFVVPVSVEHAACVGAM